MNKKISAVIMASGYGTRFGSDKLIAEINGKFMSEYIMEAIEASNTDFGVVVARNEKILSLAKKHNLNGVFNDDTENDTAYTIRLGVEKSLSSDGCMLCVADEPYLTVKSINKLISVFCENENKICRLCRNGVAGNPVIFPSSLYNELLNLEKSSRGKAVMERHKEDIVLVEAFDDAELTDIDTINDLK